MGQSLIQTSGNVQIYMAMPDNVVTEPDLLALDRATHVHVVIKLVTAQLELSYSMPSKGISDIPTTTNSPAIQFTAQPRSIPVCYKLTHNVSLRPLYIITSNQIPAIY